MPFLVQKNPINSVRDNCSSSTDQPLSTDQQAGAVLRVTAAATVQVLNDRSLRSLYTDDAPSQTSWRRFVADNENRQLLQML